MKTLLLLRNTMLLLLKLYRVGDQCKVFMTESQNGHSDEKNQVGKYKIFPLMDLQKHPVSLNALM